MLAPAGSIFSPITASNGAISTAVDAAFDIGTATSPVLIRARNGITTIEAQRIWANITANDFGGSGNITALRATAGNLTGSLTANNLPTGTANDGISVVGLLLAPVTLRGNLAGTVTLGTAVTPGLGSQIIANASNGSGTWTGAVRVNGAGSAPIVGPYYSQTSGAVGGGAVGLAPFQAHGDDCSPPHGSNIPSGGIPNNEVILRHYGPVIWDTGMPVTVEYAWAQYPNLPASWTDITRDFTVGAYDPANPRQVRVIPTTSLDFDGPLAYRIKPVGTGNNRLYCQSVSNSPSVGDYAYIIWVVPGSGTSATSLQMLNRKWQTSASCMT